VVAPRSVEGGDVLHDGVEHIGAAFRFGGYDGEVARVFVNAEYSMRASAEGRAGELMEVHNKAGADRSGRGGCRWGHGRCLMFAGETVEARAA
jgi:hypothetical protein